jgi:hypothetical protein
MRRAVRRQAAPACERNAECLSGFDFRQVVYPLETWLVRFSCGENGEKSLHHEAHEGHEGFGH